jgi:hypothetical protein
MRAVRSNIDEVRWVSIAARPTHHLQVLGYHNYVIQIPRPTTIREATTLIVAASGTSSVRISKHFFAFELVVEVREAGEVPTINSRR